MKTVACLVLVLCLSLSVSLDGAHAQVSEVDSVRLGDRALRIRQRLHPENIPNGRNRELGNRR